MQARRRTPNRLLGADAPAEPARPRVAAEFTRQLNDAEHENLRDRVARLEASIAFWAEDLDEAVANNEQLACEIERLRKELRQAGDRLAASEDARAALARDLAERDAHVAGLEARLVDQAVADADAHRDRARLHAIRRRIRARMVAQAEEIEGLRRTLALGHAARSQVEEELDACRADARRNARYLDRLEARLRDVEQG